MGVRKIPSNENDCNPPLFVELLKNLRLYNSVPLDMSNSSDMACTICDKVALCVLSVCKVSNYQVSNYRSTSGGVLRWGCFAKAVLNRRLILLLYSHVRYVCGGDVRPTK